MNLKSISVLALGALALVPGAVEACCMVPLKYDVAISQSTQEAIVMHHKDREELILRINYNITKKKESAKLPDYFAWIITVPNEPDSYKVADKDVFKDMFEFAEQFSDRKNDDGSRGPKENQQGPDTDGIEFGKRVKVGPYDIQPVRALGVEALTGLNDWLKKNGFPTEDPKHMKWFVENKFTFLAIKVQSAEGEKSVADGGDLPPMHLSFKSEKPYYPLRFSSRQGVFDLNLYLFTTKKFNYDTSGEALKKLNFKFPEFSKNFKCQFKDSEKRFGPSLPKTLNKLWSETKLNKENHWHLNVLRTNQVNKAYPISTWKDDVFFNVDA